MGDTPSLRPDLTIDLSEPWNVPARLLAALAAFDELVARIDGAVLGAKHPEAPDLDQAA